MGLDSVSSSDLPLPFGQLRLTELLSEGSGGRVFLAESPSRGGLPAHVMVRVMRPPVRRGAPTPLNELLGDLQRARNLRHAAICQTFACGVEDGVVFVISERPAGPSLAQLVLESGALPLQSAVAISAQVGLALQHAHSLVYNGRSSPLLHRHLSPEWISVEPSGRVKVSGFGLADLVSPYVAASATPSSALGFASPEVLAGQVLSSRSDVFSMGVVLAYSSLGASPFSVPTGAQKAQYLSSIVRALADGGLAARMDELAPGLGDIVLRMVALDPMGRSAQADAVVEDLRGLLEGAEEVSEELDLEGTLGHAGPPLLRASDLDRGGAPPAVEDRRPPTITEATPTPSWAAEVDADDVATDDGTGPTSGSETTDPEAQAPTDRMSSLFYREHAAGVSPPLPPQAPASIGPGSPAPLNRDPIRTGAPVPGARRRKATGKGSSPLVPVLVLMVFFVFIVLAALAVVFLLRMGGAGNSGPEAEVAVELEPAPAPAPAPEPAPEPEPEIEIEIEPEAEVVPEVPSLAPPVQASRRPAPAGDTGTADELAISHRPRRKGDSGASDLISVRVIGPADTVVEVFSGPAGGPFSGTRLKRRGSGRWEGWLAFDVPSGGVLEYWVVASYADASPAYSGSESNPHRVEVR